MKGPCQALRLWINPYTDQGKIPLSQSEGISGTAQTSGKNAVWARKKSSKLGQLKRLKLSCILSCSEKWLCFVFMGGTQIAFGVDQRWLRENRGSIDVTSTSSFLARLDLAQNVSADRCSSKAHCHLSPLLTALAENPFLLQNPPSGTWSGRALRQRHHRQRHWLSFCHCFSPW